MVTVVPLSGAVEFGPMGIWVGALATFLAALVALLAATGALDWFRAPRIEMTFEHAEPWCRSVRDDARGDLYWVRVGVENVGHATARGCVGRLMGVASDGAVHTDIDPVQVAWAGVPRSQAFLPVDLRHGQREFLNVLYLVERSRWTIDTFGDDDFYPGFTTELPTDGHHVLQVALFADNARTIDRALEIEAPTENELSLRMRSAPPVDLRRAGAAKAR